jgi:hypothetical protein
MEATRRENIYRWIPRGTITIPLQLAVKAHFPSFIKVEPSDSVWCLKLHQ